MPSTSRWPRFGSCRGVFLGRFFFCLMFKGVKHEMFFSSFCFCWEGNLRFQMSFHE